MFVDILILLIGLALLLYSADMMIGSSDLIAKKFQLSPILIGLTIVAFGTSAPELVITLFAAFKEIPATDAIIGNIIGSNIANILLILGTASLFFKIDLSNIGLKNISFLLILTSYFVAMFYIASSLSITIIIGLIVFVILFLNLLKNYGSDNEDVKFKEFSNRAYVILLFSFIGIFIGGKIFLDSSLNIFTTFGLEETIIGISILAIGTSLPELATVVISYIRKKGSIGIGNIIGSNIMNILFVFLPGAIIIKSRNLDFSLENTDLIHLNVLVLVTLIITAMSLLKMKLNKIFALGFLVSYVVYITYSVS
ncbi:MAG: sodium:calcium antiporter [Candidatus Pelagibacterales bacterium]|jgi:cation:H+ antiporter|tara:strand:- start:226 stop:1158 length:933 start_codon:yes stop_codon:yes gene_type:complete